MACINACHRAQPWGKSGGIVAFSQAVYVEGLADGDKRLYHGIVDRSDPDSAGQDLIIEVLAVKPHEYRFKVVEPW